MSFTNNMDTSEIVSYLAFCLDCGNGIENVLTKLATLVIPLALLNNYCIKEKVAKYLNHPFSGVPELAATVINKIEKLEEEKKRRRPSTSDFTGEFGGQQSSAKRGRFE